MEYFYLIPLLSLYYQIHNFHDLLHLNLAPYIPYRRLHVKLVSVTVCKRPDTVDVTEQDCIATLCGTRIIRNLAC